MERIQMNLKRLSLTDIVIEFLRRRFSLRLWRKLVSSSVVHASYVWHCKCLAWSVIFNVYNFCRCEEQVGEEFMGKEADCAEEKSCPQ